MSEFERSYKTVYRDIYDFHKKHSGAVTVNDCRLALVEMALIEDKYENDEFIAELLAAIIHEIERKQTANKDGALR